MSQIITLMQAQLARLTKSKITVAIALMGPIIALMLAIAGVNQTGVHAGYFAQTQTTSANQIISNLNNGTVILKQYYTTAECTDAVLNGNENACLILPSDDSNKTITLVLDSSNMAVGGVLLDMMRGSLENASSAIGIGLAQQMKEALDAIKASGDQGKPEIEKMVTNHALVLKILQDNSQTVSGMDSQNPADTQIDTNATNETITLINTEKQTAQLLNQQIDTLNSSINNANLTQPQKDLLIGINQNLRLQTSRINTNIDSMNDTVKNTLLSQINSINDELNASQQKMNAIGQARSTLSMNMQTAQTKMNEIAQNIASLQQAVEKISTMSQKINYDEISRIAKPLDLQVRPLKNTTKAGNVFPAILVFIISFSSLILAPRLVHMEKTAGAEVRLAMILNTKELEAVSAALTGLIIIAIQSVLLILTAYLFGVNAGVSTFIALICLGALFLLLGSAMAHLCKNEETALFSDLILGIGLFSISGSIVPIQKSTLFGLNPVLLATETIRQTAVYGTNFLNANGSMMLVLLLLLSALLLCGAVLLSRTNAMHRMLVKLKTRNEKE